MNQVATEPTGVGSAAANVRVRHATGRPLGGDSAPSRRWPTSLLERWFGRRLLAGLGDPAVELVLWDGTTIQPAGGQVRQRIFVRDRLTFWKLVWDPWLCFGEAYCDASLVVDGDLRGLVAQAYGHVASARRAGGGLSQISRILRSMSGHTVASARRNIHHHYDIGNQFYQLWLDQQMVYTCAYFSQADLSLEQAQTVKMDHVCRKVQLRPGQSVVEAGCGWGALAIHMAKHYGVTVKAYNISQQQLRYARQRARQEGLENRVHFIQGDWRSIHGQYDVFLSVGMLEHVGLRNYSRLGRVVDRCLRPSGRGLIHSIGRNHPAPTNRWIERRVFPGAYPPTLQEMTRMVQPYDFSILDVENLRLHYAQTLQHWLDRYEQSLEQVRVMFDERFVRLWRLYLVGSLVAFQEGGLQLFQVLFSRARNNQIPWTRQHLYSGADHAATRD